ncbi:hypothetical protein I4U23_014803 [Adineta vaga]|nr:hypothetical protein I4U23_014803 [Adineta vaga]
MPAYGMDIALNRKIAAKRDPNLDREAQEWVEAVIGEKFPSGSYEDALKDGVILCKLINKLQPGAIPKYATSGGAFKLRENISLFQNAARAYGLGDSELFQTIDLFEKHNIPQVTQCIFALGRNAQKKKFNGPTLGPKMSDANVREFSEDQLRAGQNSLGLLNEGMNKGTMEGSRNIASTVDNQYLTEKLQTSMRNVGRPARSETFSASSEMSESSLLSNDYQRSLNSRRLSQRKLSSSSITNLLSNLQNIRVPLTSPHTYMDDQRQQREEEEDEDEEDNEHHLQTLIDLARDTNSSRSDKLHRLHASLEDSIGMVELLSLLRFLKSSSSDVNINEPPLNLYSSILPTLSALLLLENDI